jgi:hypothetical protein
MFVFTMLLWPGALVVFLRKLSRAAERQSAGENHG